ncbi:MAG: NAD(P)-dependent oxidoreductase [Verrucomicrobiales bacterium]|nr:NAD(P)-dependent oxidoreductase [Verrucomicrobiales bacterium]
MSSDPSPQTRLGWIGTGVMGAAMVGHLLDRGHAVTVFNRTPDKARPALDKGAVWAENPREVAARSSIVFTMVGFPADVEEVYFGAAGLFAGALPGAILVDMTTTKPSFAQRIDEAAKARRARAVDAPVSGGDVGARNATLSIMVGGDPGSVAAVMPFFEVLGRTVVHAGPAGAGQHTKMCNQITIAGTMIGVCECLLYAHRAGLDPERMLEAISGGAAGCWTLSNLAPRVVRRNFDPGFYVEHFVKDMQIALEEAARMGLALPGLALVHQLYQAVMAQGHGRKGTHALMLALEHLSNVA